MSIRTCNLLHWELIGRISPKDHAELLADLRALHLTVIEALII
jgi:hypothetical protein